MTNPIYDEYPKEDGVVEEIEFIIELPSIEQPNLEISL